MCDPSFWKEVYENKDLDINYSNFWETIKQDSESIMKIENIDQQVTIHEFVSWLKQLCKNHHSLYQNIFIKRFIYTDNNCELSVQIYTKNHVYTITAINKCASHEKSYLGCILSNRCPEPGEKHTRGADLPDGPLTYRTWNDILTAILFWEIDRINEKPVYYNNEDIITFEDVIEKLKL